MEKNWSGTLAQAIQVIEETILAYGIILIALVTIANVFFRTVLNASLTFAEELAQFLIVLVTFVGLSYAASKGRHIRMSALYDQLGEHAKKTLMLVITGMTAVLMFLLAYYSVRYIVTVWELGSVSPALQIPLFLVYLAAPVGFVLAGIQYGLAFLRNLTEPTIYLSYDVKDEYQDIVSHV